MQKNVIVTGGSRGLGLGIARKLAAAGYGVIAIARGESEQLSCAIREGKSGGQSSLVFKAFDLENFSAIAALVKELRKEFGAIHGLVNNAGLGTSGILATMHDSQIERLVRLNTLSPIMLTKYVVRTMMADGGGRIVNVASIVAFTGYSGISSTAPPRRRSSASRDRSPGKSARSVSTLMRSRPGFLDTEMTESLTGQQRAADRAPQRTSSPRRNRRCRERRRVSAERQGQEHHRHGPHRRRREYRLETDLAGLDFFKQL